MSIQDAYKGLEDRVSIKQDDKKVTITATIDKDKLEKAGNKIDSYSASFANNIYQTSTSSWGNFWDWLIGADGNTSKIEANDKTFIQKGNIKYNSIGDGIIKYAKNTAYSISIDKETGKATMTFECDANGYADKVATDALYALHNSKEYLTGGKKEKPKESGKEKAPAETPEDKSGEGKTIDDTVAGAPKMPAEDSPEVEQAYQKFLTDRQEAKNRYDQLSQITDKHSYYDHVTKQMQEMQKAAEEQANTVEKPEVKNLANTRKPLPNVKDGKKDGAVKKN